MSVVDGDQYKFLPRTVSTIESITVDGALNETPVRPNSSDTGNGGSNTTAAYQIGAGLDIAVPGTGWGAGLWGGTNNAATQTTLNGAITDAAATTITLSSVSDIDAGDIVNIGLELILVGGKSSSNITGCTRGHKGTTASTHSNGAVVRLATGNTIPANDFNGWGEAVNTGVLTSTSGLRIWSHDNFGEDLLFNDRHGQIFYWDKTDGVTTRGIELSTRSGTPTSVPQKCAQILLSDRDRHVIAFGSDDIAASSSTAKETVFKIRC